MKTYLLKCKNCKRKEEHSYNPDAYTYGSKKCEICGKNTRVSSPELGMIQRQGLYD